MSLLTVLFWYISGINRVFSWECWAHWKAVANAPTRTDDDSHTHTYTHTRWERKMNTRARRSLGVRRAAALACARGKQNSLGGLAKWWKSKTLFNNYMQLFWSACYDVDFLIHTHYTDSLVHCWLNTRRSYISASVWKHGFNEKTNIKVKEM